MAKQGDGRRAPDMTEAGLWALAKHDFRQPAQALALLATAIGKAAAAEDRAELSARISQVAASLDAMVGGLSLIAGVASGAVDARRDLVSLDGALRNTVSELASHLEAISCRLTMADLASVEVLGDPGLVGAAVRGIVIGAMKGSTRGTIDVAVRHSREQGMLVLQYAGRDPEPALQRQAFVELSPLSSSGGLPSVGLGLAYVSRLAASMNGRLDAGTAVDGRRFVALALPLRGG